MNSIADWTKLRNRIPAAQFARRSKAGSIVPAATVAGQGLIAVLAIMSMLACAAAGSMSIVANSVSSWQNDVAREITIQIKPTPNVSMELLLSRAVAIAEEYPGIDRATPLSIDENIALLEPWLGAGIDVSELPVPRLILVELDRNKPLNLTNLRTAVENAIPGASVDDHRIWSDQLVTMSTSVFVAGLSIMILVIGAATLTVIFATRSAMAENRATIDVLHFVGAADAFIASEFQRHFFVQGAKGAGLGGLLAILFLALFSWFLLPSHESDGAFFSGLFQLDWSNFGWIFVVILIMAGVTAVTSRLTVYHALAQFD